MEEPSLKQSAIIGRDAELTMLKQSLADAVSGNGSTILISGEPGIGKTALVEAFKEYAATQSVKILSGAASADSAQPFLVFSKALAGEMDSPLFEEQEYTQFVKIFAINPAGMLVAEASSGEGDMDADIFAGMLSAVQNFVGDSLDTAGEQKTGLGRLEYGDMKILIEHGRHLFLTGVFSGGEHPDMKAALRRALQRIEEEHGAALEKWSGKISEVEPIRERIGSLAETKFLVRRDLEGVKLENERIRIADEALESLNRSAADLPVLVFLEDLHWADESSLFVLNYLARNVMKDCILLLGTHRPGESEALQKTMHAMKSEEILAEVRLERLDMESAKSLVDNTFSPNDFPDILAERLYEQSKGNPLFVIEMLRGMHEDGNIAMHDGKYALVSETYTIPATVEDVINRRLEYLDPDTMAMVEYASCIGQAFKADLAASNKMLKDPQASLEKLLSTGILLRKAGSLEFSHAVFQNVIYSGIGERWKCGHHRSIGEYLETAYMDRLDEVLYELARHFSKTKDYRKCFEYCKKAGEKAENSFALEQARIFYNDALVSIEKSGAGDIMGTGYHLLERVGDIEVLMGNYEEAVLKYNRWRELNEDDETRARMMRKAASVHDKRGEFDRALDILDTAKEIINDKNSPEYARILVGQGYAYWKKGNYDNARLLLEEATKLFGEHRSERRDTGNVLRAIGNIYWGKGEFGSALEYYEKSLDVMTEAGDKYGMAAAMSNIGIAHDAMGEWEKSLDSYKRGLGAYEEIGDKPGIAITLGNIGLAHYNIGELNKALEFYTCSLERKGKIGDRQGIAMSLNNIGNVHTATGDLDEALEFHGRSLKTHEAIGDKRGSALSLNNIGVVHLLKGDTGKALESHAKSLLLCQEMGQKNLSIFNHGSLAEVYVGIGDLKKALEHAEKANSIALEIELKPEEGTSQMARGIVFREMKNWEESAKAFDKAEAILKEVGKKEDIMRLNYEYGLLLTKLNRLADASNRLEIAMNEYGRMGMKLWADKCRKALEELEP